MFLLMIRRAENLSKEADDAHTRRLAGKDTGRNSWFRDLDLVDVREHGQLVHFAKLLGEFSICSQHSLDPRNSFESNPEWG